MSAATARRARSSCGQPGDFGAQGSEQQAGPNVFGLQVGEIGQNLRGAHAIREHFEDVRYPDTHPADAGASTTLSGVAGDAV